MFPCAVVRKVQASLVQIPRLRNQVIQKIHRLRGKQTVIVSNRCLYKIEIYAEALSLNLICPRLDPFCSIKNLFRFLHRHLHSAASNVFKDHFAKIERIITY